MSTSVMPVLKGLTYPATRKPMFKTNKLQSMSGKETASALWSVPRYQFSLQWSVLRQGALGATTWTELSQLEGFFNSLFGAFDSWLYQDPNDNAVVNQALGVGDGATTVFPLVRSFGGFSMPVLAPNLSISPTITVNGSTASPSGYSITPWATSDSHGSGKLIFTSAPGAGATIAGSFSFYFPCRFDDDAMSFELFNTQRYSADKTTFTSIK